MKKKITILMSIFALGFGINANAQAVSEGNVLIDTYAGGPNIFSSMTRNSIVTTLILDDIRVTGIPCLGLRVGYMVSDRVSAGIDVNYTNSNLKYRDTDGYDYTLSIPRLRAMFRFELHFQGSENFDFYMPIGVGYSSLKFDLSTNNPDYSLEQSTIFIFPYPIAFRLGLGGRYFFNDNIGLNAEIGVGGGTVFEGGLALKF